MSLSTGHSSSPVHLLKSSFSFWYLNRSSSAHESYEESIKKMCTFSSVESFWQHYSHLKRPSTLSSAVQILLFREGIRPMWEDPANAKGGKWQLRFKKGVANRVWESVLLAIVGDSFGLNEEICGCVLTSKANEDILAIWNRSATNKDVNIRIREILKQALGIDHNQALEYRPHDQAIKNLQTTATAAPATAAAAAAAAAVPSTTQSQSQPQSSSSSLPSTSLPSQPPTGQAKSRGSWSALK